jgi:flagellar motor switch protein FliM
MTDVLSQQEIDQLLTAVNAEDTEPEDFRPVHDTRKIKIYDFKRPDKFTRDQIRTICMIHEGFAWDVSAVLSKHLKKDVHVHVASVDQMTYEEFIRFIPTPTTLAVLDMFPLGGKAILEIDPNITLAMTKGKKIKKHYELTKRQNKAIEDIFLKLLGPLRDAWTKINVIDDLRPKIEVIDSEPQFCQIVPPTEMIVLVTFECKFDGKEGIINFCLPDTTIHSIANKLTARHWYTGKTVEKKEAEMGSLGDINIPVIVELGRKDIPLKEIQGFKEGTIFEFDKLAGEPLDIYANNVLVAKGEVVVIDENFGVRVTEVTYAR